ncbi:MAG: ribonuclease HII [Pseudomonadota bacterium]
MLCGIDEVGRGPLAGPVLACAVVLKDPTGQRLARLNDSKALAPKRRAALAKELGQAALRGEAIIGLGAASVAEIDRLNILRANDLAMRRALAKLGQPVALALIDGNRVPPDLPCKAHPIVKGDARSASIAAASIIAKECRDHLMRRLALRYPAYGWEKNAGYPTATHRRAIALRGLSPHHRRSFRSCQLSRPA